MAHMLAGQFPDRMSAERARTALYAGGFDPQRVSLVSQERVEGVPPPQQKAARSLTGSLLGILVGAIVGALTAWLTSTLVQRVASTTTAGVIVCAIIGGAIGWFLGGIAGSRQPIEEGEYRQERVELGRMLLTLDPDDREAEARDILLRFGAREVRTSGESERPGGDPGESQHALT